MILDQVCIIGVGYVGEILVDIFSKKNKVIGYDISPKRAYEMNEKFKNRNITIQNDFKNIENSKLFCITVPTLLNPTDGTVDETCIKNAVKIIEQYAQSGSTVVMESSVYVGMTRKLLFHLRNRGIFVGFSGERVDPGRLTPTVDKIPKIISGIDQASLDKISEMYGEVFETLVPVSTLETAEMCKLSENCFRMINIAYANEISDACNKLNINPYEVINTCSTKPFGYMPFYPGLGVGGHCIPVNPSWLAVTCKNEFPLLMKATEITLNRPKREAQNLIKYNPKIKNVLVIGIAFKPGESTTVNSPGLDYANELMKSNINVTLYDPNVAIYQYILKKPFNILLQHQYTTSYIDSHFDTVCIAIKQINIDWTILQKCKCANIIKYCDI